MVDEIKKKIQTAKDLKIEIVSIPEWGVDIEVRTMTAGQRANLFAFSTDEKGTFIQQKFQIGIVVAACYDPETKEKLFEESDVEWLLQKAAGPIEKLVNKISAISGLTRQAVENMEKN